MHNKNNEIIKIGKSQIFSDNSCVNIFSHFLRYFRFNAMEDEWSGEA